MGKHVVAVDCHIVPIIEKTVNEVEAVCERMRHENTWYDSLKHTSEEYHSVSEFRMKDAVDDTFCVMVSNILQMKVTHEPWGTVL